MAVTHTIPIPDGLGLRKSPEGGAGFGAGFRTVGCGPWVHFITFGWFDIRPIFRARMRLTGANIGVVFPGLGMRFLLPHSKVFREQTAGSFVHLDRLVEFLNS